MKTIKRVSTLQKYLQSEKKKKRKIGFIPTMGALHQGHMSLVKKSNEENDITVVSVFVNPTQFNQKEDLEKYPRVLEEDARLLKENNNDYLFAPAVTQVYPKNLKSIKLNIDHLTFSMEGPNRPGHFEGVVQVVHRLLDIVKPDAIYMGQKDFQQFTIVNYMIDQLKMKTRLRVCPIIRESDGLAMSSRNRRLTKSIRPKCSIIHETLSYVKSNLNKRTTKFLEKKALEKMSIKNFKPEYFNIVDGYTLENVSDPKKHDYIVACTAVWAKNIRLIDNMILKGGENLI